MVDQFYEFHPSKLKYYTKYRSLCLRNRSNNSRNLHFWLTTDWANYKSCVRKDQIFKPLSQVINP